MSHRYRRTQNIRMLACCVKSQAIQDDRYNAANYHRETESRSTTDINLVQSEYKGKFHSFIM